ncbi:acyltransferase [Halopseudomonas nanhaiensis]|uniref:acyltransferase family protein n=1 Tax=Halopseudomonas nanhaiensis TaxID=2830842 RepID=UPI001CBE5750|nr:acyltransferase [Halopseudomonas nanhaiensis]UAW97555.1 acyltransferase [Halopseudomonas nanhaiensis]
MDMLRGVAICLVVMYHCTVYMYEKYPDAFAGLKYASELVGPLRMPVLFFLSGMLLAGSIKKGPKRYALGKINNLVYPFVVWTLVLYLLYEVREIALGLPSEIELFTALVYDPWHHLWFLHYLSVYYILGYFLFKAGFVVAALVAVSLYAVGYPTGHGYFTALFMFFVAGAFANRSSNLARWIDAHEAQVVCAGLLVIALCMTGVIVGLLPMAKHNLTYCIVAAAGLPILISLTKRAEHCRIAPALAYLGRNSLVLYMVHVPVGIAIPLLIERTEWNPVLVYPAYLAVVFTACLGVVWLRQRSKSVDLMFSAEQLYPRRHKDKLARPAEPDV